MARQSSQSLRAEGGAAIEGTEGDDRLQGADRDERLRGHRGDDTLIGGLGNDTLAGGDGDDIFVFGQDGVYDTILDFGQVAGDRDHILIDDPETAAFADLAISYSDGDAFFSYATVGELRQIVTVRGIGEGGLTADDFLFGPAG